MKTRVLISIDTELLWKSDRGPGGAEEMLKRSYDPAGVGVPYQLRMLAQYGLKACFFVDPMPALAHGIGIVRRMVEPILEAGQEVQLHLHPQWRGWRAPGVSEAQFELTAHDEAGQRAIIAEARGLLIGAGAPAPIAFRAGSYGANDDTLRALAALGIRYDSSHNGSHQPWPNALSLEPEQIAPIAHHGVIELPVTQISDGGRLRHLQLCAVSASEMAAALDHAAAENHALVTIVSHSFELSSRDRQRPNMVHLRRFQALCAYLAERRELLPTAFVSDLHDLPLDRSDRPVAPSVLRRFARQAEQLWSNTVHERAA